MKHFNEQISKAKTIAITGHIHPDGDCIGSCLALKQYILDNYSGKKVDVYLESISTEFRFLSHAQEIIKAMICFLFQIVALKIVMNHLQQWSDVQKH